MEQTLTVPRLKALQEEWRRNPPVPMMVAAYLGIKPQDKGTPEGLVEKLMGLPGVLRKKD